MALTSRERQRNYNKRKRELEGTCYVTPADLTNAEAFRLEMLGVLRRIALESKDEAVRVSAAGSALKHLGMSNQQAFVAMLGGPERALLWLQANRDRLMAQLSTEVPRETEQGREAEEDERGT